MKLKFLTVAFGCFLVFGCGSHSNTDSSSNLKLGPQPLVSCSITLISDLSGIGKKPISAKGIGTSNLMPGLVTACKVACENAYNTAAARGKALYSATYKGRNMEVWGLTAIEIVPILKGKARKNYNACPHVTPSSFQPVRL